MNYLVTQLGRHTTSQGNKVCDVGGDNQPDPFKINDWSDKPLYQERKEEIT